MKLVFTINDSTFELGALVEPGTLENAALQRAGLFKRLINRIPLGSNRYDAMNCTLACFEDEFSLYPCTHRYLNKDRQWRTRASVFSQKDKIHRIQFHVLEGQYAATSFLGRFQEACNKALGEPTLADRWKTKWVKDKTKVICTLHQDKINADFLIETSAE